MNDSKLKQHLHFWMKKYFYLNLCYDMAQHLVGNFKEVGRDVALLFLVVKSFGMGMEVAILVSVGMFAAASVVGHYSIKLELPKLQTSISNQNTNKELMDIHRAVNKK